MNDFELRRQLRNLPKEIAPARDLWPGIAAQLPPQTRRLAKSNFWPRCIAIAACLGLAIGLVANFSAQINFAEQKNDQVALREVQAMTKDYQFALGQLEVLPVAEDVRPALVTLDGSAASIEQALRSRPQSRVLLEQLRRTYARRLALTQRGLVG